MSSVIVSGARTPMGRLLGNLKDFPATELGGIAIREALRRGGVAPGQVQYVIMGQVLQAGAGRRPAAANPDLVEDTIAVQENGAPHRTDSHLASAVFKSGCETSRCQTTAWKASACGVRCAGFTSGTTSGTSAS